MNCKWAYLAGLVDGEGTITIHRHQQHLRKTFQYRPRLIVSNNSLDLMNYLVSEFGGTLASHQRPEGNRAYLWRLFAQDELIEVIENIRPYLRIKERHAEVILRFLRARVIARVGEKNAGYGLTELECYEALRVMNLRGVVEVVAAA